MATPPVEDMSQLSQWLWAIRDWVGVVIGTGALGFLWTASGRIKSVEITIEQHDKAIGNVERRVDLAARSVDLAEIKTRVDQSARIADLAEIKVRVDRAADKVDIEDIKTMIRDLTARVNRRFDMPPAGTS
jgi:hypothetical protein